MPGVPTTPTIFNIIPTPPSGYRQLKSVLTKAIPKLRAGNQLILNQARVPLTEAMLKKLKKSRDAAVAIARAHVAVAKAVEQALAMAKDPSNQSTTPLSSSGSASVSGGKK